MDITTNICLVSRAKKRTLVRGYLFSTVVNFNQRC
nr:MAG TPA: hypothetical protein [Caudoviricetes sp.]DAV14338.1 MAG TPA: hypothetical protein [Caudoviricetes sp.]